MNSRASTKQHPVSSNQYQVSSNQYLDSYNHTSVNTISLTLSSPHICMFHYIFILICKRDLLPPPPVDNNIETDQYVLEPHTVNISTNLPGFYSAVPGHYYRNNLMYPLLIYIHGA